MILFIEKYFHIIDLLTLWGETLDLTHTQHVTCDSMLHMLVSLITVPKTQRYFFIGVWGTQHKFKQWLGFFGIKYYQLQLPCFFAR
jgi:hypothetical protein